MHGKKEQPGSGKDPDWGESFLILFVSFLILFIATLTYSTTIGRQSQCLPAEDTLLPQIGRIATWRLVDARKFLRSFGSPASGKKAALVPATTVAI